MASVDTPGLMPRCLLAARRAPVAWAGRLVSGISCGTSVSIWSNETAAAYGAGQLLSCAGTWEVIKLGSAIS